MRAPAIRILGLDLGCTTGWCRLYCGKYLDSGSVVLSQSQNGHVNRICRRFKRWVMYYTDIDLIMFKDSSGFYSSNHAAVIERSMIKIFDLVREKLNVQYISITPSALKKFATGKDNSSKSIIIKAANIWLKELGHRRRLIATREGHINEANAIHIARYGSDFIDQLWKYRVNPVCGHL